MNDAKFVSDVKPRIEASIQELVQSCATDGYVMRLVDFDGRRLRIGIEASAGACADCLVPVEIMSELIRASLPADILVHEIEIAYPGSGSGAH